MKEDASMKPENLKVIYNVLEQQIARTLILLGLSTASAPLWADPQFTYVGLPRTEFINVIEQNASRGNLQLPRNWGIARDGILNPSINIDIGVWEPHIPRSPGSQGAFTWKTNGEALRGMGFMDIISRSEEFLTSGTITPTIMLSSEVFRNPSFMAAAVAHEGIHAIDSLTPAGRAFWTAAMLGATTPNIDNMLLATIDSNFEKVLAYGHAFNVFTEYNAFSSIAESRSVLSDDLNKAIDNVTKHYFSADGIIDEFAARRSAAELLAEFSSYNDGIQRLLAVSLMSEDALDQSIDSLHNLLRLKALGQDLLPESAVLEALMRLWHRLGRAASNSLPYIGTAAGIGFATYDASAGNYADAIFGYIGCVPVIGDAAEIPYVVGSVVMTGTINYAESCNAEDDAIYKLKKDLFNTFFDSEIQSQIRSIIECHPNMDSRLLNAYQKIADFHGEEVPNEYYWNLLSAINAVMTDEYQRIVNQEESSSSGDILPLLAAGQNSQSKSCANR